MGNCQNCHHGTHQKLADNAEQFVSYETEQVVTWCGGCGNYGIQNALMRALALEGLTDRDVLICYDVGCSGNGSDKIHAHTIHGLHGRVLPLAAGVKLANHKMKVIASAGDGATFSEGVGHIVHAVRSDYPILFLHHNNQNYALTTGQPSSLTPLGKTMSAAPDGVFQRPLKHMELVLGLGVTFLGRSLSADVDHLTEMIRAGLRHNGFAFIDILQTCPTYNREANNAWYLDHTKPVPEGHDVTDANACRTLLTEMSDEVYYTGILHQVTDVPNYYDAMPSRHGVESVLVDEVKHYPIGHHLDRL